MSALGKTASGSRAMVVGTLVGLATAWLAWPPVTSGQLPPRPSLASGGTGEIATGDAAGDVVWVVDRSGRERQRRGRIVDYGGEGLVLETASGQQQRIPIEQLQRFRYERPATHRAAITQLQSGHPAEALELIRQAIREEQREWVRRELLALSVECYASLDRLAPAGDMFLSLLASDSETPHFGEIPLQWSDRPLTPELESKAADWMGQSSAAARLLGASWLLGRRRADSLTVLEQLATHADRRIAALAEAQRWRDAVVAATPAEVAAWERQIQRMPRPLRAGPCYALGAGLARTGQPKRAAVAYLRIPVLYSQQRSLAAAALLAAGEQLQRLGDRPAAERLFAEARQWSAAGSWTDRQAEALADAAAEPTNPGGLDPPSNRQSP